jgi:hypothetical protein
MNPTTPPTTPNIPITRSGMLEGKSGSKEKTYTRWPRENAGSNSLILPQGPSKNIDVHHNPNNVKKGRGKHLVLILFQQKKLQSR